MSSASVFTRRTKIAALGLGFLTAALIGLSYWIVSVVYRPDEPISVRIMYRDDDTDYLPFIYALARLKLHEFVVPGGGNLLPFPLLMDVPHAAMVALFGDWGFAVADVAIMLVWFLLFLLLARIFVDDWRAAVLISLGLLIAGGPWNWQHLNLSPFEVWGFRYTRPFIAGLFMLGLVLTTRSIAAGFLEGRPKHVLYLIQGLLLGGASQGDMHLALIGSFVTAGLYLIALAAPRSRRLSLRAALLTGIGFALGVLPMAVQQTVSRNSDYIARLGMFPVDRLHPPFHFDADDAVALASVAGLWLLIFLLAQRYAPRQMRNMNLLMGVILAYLVFSILTLTLSTMIMGHGFLLYEFQDRRIKFTHLGILVGIAMLAVLAYHALRGRFESLVHRAPVPALIIGALVLVGVSVQGVRKSLGLAIFRAETTSQPRVFDTKFQPKLVGWWQFGWPILPNYRSDFVALVNELRRPEYASYRILGTFDQQLGVWWLAFRKGYLFIPDTFASTASDKLIEQRTLGLLRLVGSDQGFFNRRLNEPYFIERFLTHGKWQASQAYTYHDLGDYDLTQLDVIKKTTVLESWSTLTPRSERKRLLAAFGQTSPPRHPPDMIILPKGAGYESLPGPGAPYRLAYENRTFRMWVSDPQPDAGS